MSIYKQHKLYRPLKKCLGIATIQKELGIINVIIIDKVIFKIHVDSRNNYVEICDGELYLFFKKYFKCNQSMNLFIRVVVSDVFKILL